LEGVGLVSVNPHVLPVNGLRDLIGQPRAVRLLQQGLRNGRTPQAYLFAGPDGIGKRTAALALARALNCQEGEDRPDGCGACLSCRKIAKGLHPDVQVIEPAGAAMKIDQVRALEADAALGLYEGKRRVFILDGAERMTDQAANAILKTLEEPPARSVLILLTRTPSALPPTIVSRCQAVSFSPIPLDTLHDYLVRRGVEPDDARLIASFSRGSLGRALSQATESLASTRDRLLEDVERAFRDGPAALIDIAEQRAKDRETVQRQCELLSAWFRDLMVASVSRGQASLVNLDRGEAVARRSHELPLHAILDGLRAIHAAMDGLARHANPRLTLEHLLFRLCEAAPSGLS
jgi:DNA polymerase-3 subunit delta'